DAAARGRLVPFSIGRSPCCSRGGPPPSARLISTLALAVAAAGGAATLAVTQMASAATGTPLPAHVFAPYFEAWNGDSLSGLSSQSGAKYLTMAFLQAATKGSCTVYWNGDTSLPISSSSFGSDISSIRAAGGGVR